jgi:hypothetical protein
MRVLASGLMLIALTAGAVAAGPACGGSETTGPQAPGKSGTAVSAHDAGTDLSRCDFRGRADREVSETAGPGAVVPNVRRVYAIVGDSVDARRVLICREVDTNLDGMKDVVRVYSDRGEAANEQADTNYDGRIDTWITFAAGRIGRIELDTDHDGRPDETQHFSEGSLVRIERDTNRDGKTDVWEVYANGRLQRMGVDLDHDGHVDRWDRDEITAREEEAREREEEEAQEREKRQQEEALSDGGVTDARVSARNR